MSEFITRLSRKVRFWRWPSYYRAHIIKITTSGYIPVPSAATWRNFRWFLRFWCFMQVGKVTVIGGEHLDTPGRVIFCPNHSSLLDAQVMFPIMKRRCRGLGAHEPLRKAFGIPALIMTRLGVFPVDRANGNTVIEPAIGLLAAGEALAIFPEGKISPSGEFLPFKSGAGRIVKGAYERIDGKEPVGIVPIHIHYKRRHNASATSYQTMGFRWRGGAIVTVMPPIWYGDLPVKDVTHMMQAVKNAITAVDDSFQAGQNAA